jgi:hypothetical protein
MAVVVVVVMVMPSKHREWMNGVNIQDHQQEEEHKTIPSSFPCYQPGQKQLHLNSP